MTSPTQTKLEAARRLSAAQGNLVHDTVTDMMACIGELRKFMALDSMPLKLQQVRQLLRELDHEMSQRK